ncbi:GNAT family N-acetyltransferase [Reinekea blandensis]|uniref:N-acetyltransferase domain-containing protein n=1 Tax=Reinekea blandensis MED297 TaxID=314283 RepID=A4BHJ3_9GAMM|nr:GNAT family N-acetyltransferase [Reinekea blandensis]EAR08391.1 hypothetical protein MED297_16664 [Reinekea blandensis MED297]
MPSNPINKKLYKACQQVTVRPLKPEDQVGLIRLLTHAQVRRFLGGPLSLKLAERRVQRMLTETIDSRLAIETNGQFAGMLSWSDHCEEPGTEISYQIFPEYEGQGLAYRALKSALPSLTGPIIAETQINNHRSIALLIRLGFKHLRTVRRHNAEQVIMTLDKQEV